MFRFSRQAHSTSALVLLTNDSPAPVTGLPYIWRTETAFFWPSPVPVHDELYGDLGCLRQTAAFFRGIQVGVWRFSKQKKLLTLISRLTTEDGQVLHYNTDSQEFLPLIWRSGGGCVKMLLLPPRTLFGLKRETYSKKSKKRSSAFVRWYIWR